MTETLMAGHRPFRDLVKHINADPVRRARIDAAKRAMDDVLALAELREQRGTTQTEDAGPLSAERPPGYGAVRERCRPTR